MNPSAASLDVGLDVLTKSQVQALFAILQPKGCMTANYVDFRQALAPQGPLEKLPNTPHG